MKAKNIEPQRHEGHKELEQEDAEGTEMGVQKISFLCSLCYLLFNTSSSFLPS
jgi:hypothetical protein